MAAIETGEPDWDRGTEDHGGGERWGEGEGEVLACGHGGPTRPYHLGRWTAAGTRTRRVGSREPWGRSARKLQGYWRRKKVGLHSKS